MHVRDTKLNTDNGLIAPLRHIIVELKNFVLRKLQERFSNSCFSFPSSNFLPTHQTQSQKNKRRTKFVVLFAITISFRFLSNKKKNYKNRHDKETKK